MESKPSFEHKQLEMKMKISCLFVLSNSLYLQKKAPGRVIYQHIPWRTKLLHKTLWIHCHVNQQKDTFPYHGLGDIIHGSWSIPRHCLLLLGQRIPLKKRWSCVFSQRQVCILRFIGHHLYNMLMFCIPTISLRVDTKLKIRKKWTITH